MKLKTTAPAITFILAVILTIGACKKMETIKNGSKVDFHYTLTVDGNVVESSFGKDPLNYEHGGPGVIQGMQEALEGLKKGDKKMFTIPPEKAYGERNEQAIIKIPKSSINEADKLKVGNIATLMQGERKINAIITDIGDKEVTFDYNHPMAGKTLTFDIEVVNVENPAGK